MKLIGITVLVFLKILYIENRMLPISYVTNEPGLQHSTPRSGRVSASISQSFESIENPQEKVIGLQTSNDDRESDEYYEYDKNHGGEMPKKPCAIVVVSNIQNPNMQSLLRKYRYDGNGVLIPSSVKYFIKLPQGMRASPILVPLNDKAFSPLGGFVRYYKEVPPIPHSW